MFFEQGYNLYLEAVQAKKIYKIKNSQCAPWGELELKVRKFHFINVLLKKLIITL